MFQTVIIKTHDITDLIVTLHSKSMWQLNKRKILEIITANVINIKWNFTRALNTVLMSSTPAYLYWKRFIEEDDV